jgi:hypothetical protein
MPDKTASSNNGWRHGHDPVQRWLRIVSVIVMLVIAVYLTIAPSTGTDRLVIITLALGALLVLLGYESIVHLPGLSKKDDRDGGNDE